MWFSHKSWHANQHWSRSVSALVNSGLSWSVLTISSVAQAETVSQLMVFGFASFSPRRIMTRLCLNVDGLYNSKSMGGYPRALFRWTRGFFLATMTHRKLDWRKRVRAESSWITITWRSDKLPPLIKRIFRALDKCDSPPYWEAITFSQNHCACQRTHLFLKCSHICGATVPIHPRFSISQSSTNQTVIWRRLTAVNRLAIRFVIAALTHSRNRLRKVKREWQSCP
jgi:hypothetical protein